MMNYVQKDLGANQCTFINLDMFTPINYFTITAKRSGRVMQAKSLSSIVIWDYNGGDNQLWFWDPSNGHFLRNKAFPNKVQWIGFTPSSIFFSLHYDLYRQNSL